MLPTARISPRSTILRHPLMRSPLTKRWQSSPTYQAPKPTNSNIPSNPHRSFYRTFGRPIVKNFLIAILTYQVIYYSWMKLDSLDVKKTKTEELRALEGEVRALTRGEAKD